MSNAAVNMEQTVNKEIELYDDERIESFRKEKFQSNSKYTGIPADFFDNFTLSINLKILENGGQKLIKNIVSKLAKHMEKLISECGTFHELRKLIKQFQTGSSVVTPSLLQYSGKGEKEIEAIAELLQVVAKAPSLTKERGCSKLDKVRGYAPLELTIDRQDITGSRQKVTAYTFGKAEVPIPSNRHDVNVYLTANPDFSKRTMNLASLLAEIYFMNSLENFARNNPEVYEYAFAEYYATQYLSIKDNGKTLRLPIDDKYAATVMSLITKYNILPLDDIRTEQVNDFKLDYYFPLNESKMNSMGVNLLAKEFIQTVNYVIKRVNTEIDNHNSVAKAYQTKKNINKDTLAAMQNNPFLKKFGYVELDNDVDLTQFEKLGNEFKKLCTVTYIPDAKDHAFRMKKLGKHSSKYNKVNGLYTTANVLCDLDGVKAFIHEHGHKISATWRGDGRLLSEELRFRPIVTAYRKEVLDTFEELGEGDAKKSLSKGAYNLDYYFQMDEIFARSYEIYLHSKGIRSSLLKKPSEYDDKEAVVYPSSPSFVKLVVAYFDELFEGCEPDKEDEDIEAITPKQEKKKVTFVADSSMGVEPSNDVLITYTEGKDGQLSLF